MQDITGGEVTQVTGSLNRKVYHLRWLPDGKKILFGNQDFAIFFVDLASRKLTKIDESRYLDNDEFTWEVSDYAWSPDGRWIAYSFPRENRNNVIFLYDTVEAKKVQIAYNVLQGMEPYRYPNPASRAHFVLVSNEDNGSDGEAFVEHFKARKLGTVVGVPSWGGLVGIVNGQRTIDNGRIEQSNNAFYDRDGKWMVENHGADPDVVQDNDPASVMAGKDLQLEKAVEIALKKIKEQPWQFPPPPKYPEK